jgi:hypothetical protein
MYISSVRGEKYTLRPRILNMTQVTRLSPAISQVLGDSRATSESPAIEVRGRRTTGFDIVLATQSRLDKASRIKYATHS